MLITVNVDVFYANVRYLTRWNLFYMFSLCVNNVENLLRCAILSTETMFHRKTWS